MTRNFNIISMVTWRSLSCTEYVAHYSCIITHIHSFSWETWKVWWLWTEVRCLRTRSKIDSREQGYEPQIPLNVGSSVTRHSTFSNYQLNAQFFYSSTICMLHYDPQHVSSSTLLILRRTNCITTASGIVTLEIGERSSVNSRTVCRWRADSVHSPPAYCMAVYRGLFTNFQGDDTRGCGDTICPPEDEQHAARNMLRIVV